MSKNKKRLGTRKTDELINQLDLAPVLDERVRQVRWLYNNNNKCTKVYEEKLVRLMIHRLQERITELESTIYTKQNTMQKKDILQGFYVWLAEEEIIPNENNKGIDVEIYLRQ